MSTLSKLEQENAELQSQVERLTAICAANTDRCDELYGLIEESEKELRAASVISVCKFLSVGSNVLHNMARLLTKIKQEAE